MITDAQAATANEFWHVNVYEENARVRKPLAIARRRGPTIYGVPDTGWSIPIVMLNAQGREYGHDLVITNVENVMNGLMNVGWCVPELWAAERHLFLPY
jgi:hypothetical protein